MNLISAMGLCAGVLTTICWLPQAWRTIRTRDTQSISLLFQSLFALGLAMWIVYGLAIASMPLVLANVVSLPPVLVILGIKVANLRRERAAA
ncbi:MAG TPA: SemiSWEET transporter [Caulobacteraceae bacterium]